MVRTLRTITKRAVPWFGSVQPECTVPLGTDVEFPKFRTGIFVEWKEPKQLHIQLQKYNMGHILCNGNRTEWSPIRSVIIRVINKIGRPHSGSPICLITSMITDWIGRHEVLLPINHNSNKICNIYKALFWNQNRRNSNFFLLGVKKSHLIISARLMARTVQLLRHDAYCPIELSN